MIVDVSEIKEFRHCKRKWQLSSRNSFHLRPCVTPPAFKMGTVFHECLHKLYLGKSIEAVLEYADAEMVGSEKKDTMLLRSMVAGYDKEVLPYDGKYAVLDIEHHFKVKPFDLLDEIGKAAVASLTCDPKDFVDLEIAGSIDMIALDVETNEVWGFEHKTAKNFRNDSYLWMDEQPRVYYAVLVNWVAKFNKQRHDDWITQCKLVNAALVAGATDIFYPEEPEPVTLGGVFINEVRKVVREFSYKRSPLKYSPDDLRNFLLSFLTSCAECHKTVGNPNIPRIPSPDLMTCQMCQFNTVCQEFQYKDMTLDQLLTEFGQEFEVRKEDHLAEKEEVTTAQVAEGNKKE